MEWAVVKTGATMFDASHAYGLALVLAYASEAPVTLWDEGVVYRVRDTMKILPETTGLTLLERLLALPELEQLQGDRQNLAKDPVRTATLNGLLVASFTSPGPRLLSVLDLIEQQKQSPSRAKAGLDKAKAVLSRCHRFIEGKARNPSTWLVEALRDYEASRPVTPVLAPRADRSNLAIFMAVEPAFSCATYRCLSDGFITKKTNLTLRRPRYASLLALIGATRFLQAQRTADKSLNVYLPLPGSITLHPETTLPLLASIPIPPEQAIVYQGLVYSKMARARAMDWAGLAYQTLQPQPQSQSISLRRGVLDTGWLNSLNHQLSSKMTRYWESLLGSPEAQLPLELTSLIDCLSRRRLAAWLDHLYKLSLQAVNNTQGNLRPYTLTEIKEVTRFMVGPKGMSSMGAIFEREEGTLRFGHALRLLGQVNHYALGELIESLDSAHQPDQLIRIAGSIAQQCAVATAQSDFVIVPNENDLKYMLADIDRLGPRKIALLLISLAFVRYPSPETENHKAASRLSEADLKGEE